VIPIAAISTAAFVPTIYLSGRWSALVSLAWGVALSIVAPIELIGLGALLPANHPIRFALPALLGALAFVAMYREKATRWKFSRAYIMALLTFFLASIDVAAPFLFVLENKWIVPSFTILVCALICIVATVPKGRLSWLLS